MIITLAKADFSKNNIGVLNSFVVLTDLAAGLVYNGVTAPEKNQPFSANIAINPGYALDEIVVSMGGVILEDACMITSNGVLIEIPSVTGMIVITASSYSTTEPAIITYNYVDTEGNVIRTAKTESATKGTTREFSTVGQPWVAGYEIASVSPESATIKSDVEVNYVYDVHPDMDEGEVMLAVNILNFPELSANVYCSGFTATDNKQRIIVTKGKNPTYQVAKRGYLSQGSEQKPINANTTVDIELVPISGGNWQTIDLDGSDVTLVKDYFVTNTGKQNGPYTTWEAYIVPATEGTYRVTAFAGQSAICWAAYANMPSPTDGAVKPLAYSKNAGMSVEICEEFTAPAGTNYIVVNTRKDSGYKNIVKLEKLMD
jgi:hypothetical protein